MFKQYDQLSRQTKIFQQYIPEHARVERLSIYSIRYHQYAHITVYPENDQNNHVDVWMEMHMDGPCIRMHTREHHQQCHHDICGRYQGDQVITLHGDALRDALTLWRIWDGLDQTLPYHSTEYNCTHYARELVWIALNTQNYRLITTTTTTSGPLTARAYLITYGKRGQFVWISALRIVPRNIDITNQINTSLISSTHHILGRLSVDVASA